MSFKTFNPTSKKFLLLYATTTFVTALSGTAYAACTMGIDTPCYLDGDGTCVPGCTGGYEESSCCALPPPPVPPPPPTCAPGCVSDDMVLSDCTVIVGACVSPPPPPVCIESSGTETGGCPVGQTGSASRSVTYDTGGTCGNTVYGGWDYSGCSPVCVESSSSDTGPCPPGETGSATRILTHDAGGTCGNEVQGPWDYSNCHAPVPGVCGTANGVPTLTQPGGSALCNVGTNTPVAENASNFYTWNCNGLWGGAPVACTAAHVINASCGSDTSTGSDVLYPADESQTCQSWYGPGAHCRRTDRIGPPVDLCGNGTYVENSMVASSGDQADGNWTWTCQGINGGTSTTVAGTPGDPATGGCGAYNASSDAQCNGAYHMKSLTDRPPESNALCSFPGIVFPNVLPPGTYYYNFRDPGDNGTTNRWTWSCRGVYGGANADNCYAIVRADSAAGCGAGYPQPPATPAVVISKPTSGLCPSGYTASSVEQNGSMYSWWCRGVNRGLDSKCVATQQPPAKIISSGVCP